VDLLIRELEHDIRFQIDSYVRLNDLVECTLRERSEAMAEQRQKEAGGKAFFPSRPEIEASISFPRLTRNYLLVSIYSFAEWELYFLCVQLFRSPDEAEMLALRPKGPGDVIKYLRRRWNLKLPDFFDKDGPCMFYKALRDCVVHRYGFMYDDEKEKLRQLLLKVTPAPDIEVDDGSGKIMLGDMFMPDMIQRLRNAFDELFDHIREILCRTDE